MTDKDEKPELPAISNEQRIDAAIALLQAKDIERIIFIGHGAGGNLAVEILDNETTPIQALILVPSNKPRLGYSLTARSLGILGEGLIGRL